MHMRFWRGTLSVGQHGLGVISTPLDTKRDGSLLKEVGNHHTGCSAEFVSVLVPSHSIAIHQGGRQMRHP